MKISVSVCDFLMVLSSSSASASLLIMRNEATVNDEVTSSGEIADRDVTPVFGAFVLGSRKNVSQACSYVPFVSKSILVPFPC